MGFFNLSMLLFLSNATKFCCMQLKHYCLGQKQLQKLVTKPQFSSNARVWLDNTNQYLVTSGFQTSNARFSFYVKKIDHGIVVIVIYVDDLIVIRDSDVDIFDQKKLLKQNFEMKDLGKLCYFLGIKVIQSLKGI